MAAELENRLAQVRQGDHICLIYENAAEQLAVAVPFIRDGLFRGAATLARFVGGVQLFSLQKGPGREELADWHEEHALIDLGRRLEDFADSAPAHLAGAWEYRSG